MADITYNPVAGVPFSGPVVMKDLTGSGTTFAPLSMGIAGSLPVQSLSAVSAVGAGSMLDNQGVRNNHSLVVVTAGTVTSGNVQLEGSQDGTNWMYLLATAGIPALSGSGINGGPNGVWYLTASLTPFRFLRAAITVVIGGGGTISAWVASAG